MALPSHTVLVAGVDGVKNSWIVALVSTEGRVAWVCCASARGVLATAGGCASVAVDIPIGLPTNGYGLDGAMQTILAQPFGKFLLTAVAVGFMAFGVFVIL